MTSHNPPNDIGRQIDELLPSGKKPINTDALREMAEDAFIVLNWARREGLKKDEQIRQVRRAFETRLEQHGVAVEQRKQPEPAPQTDGGQE